MGGETGAGITSATVDASGRALAKIKAPSFAYNFAQTMHAPVSYAPNVFIPYFRTTFTLVLTTNTELRGLVLSWRV